MAYELYRRFSLFADLPDSDLASVAAVAKPRRYARDEVVIREDERGDVFCLIKQGRVKITMTSPEGKELILSTLGPGQFFGEMALLDDEPRSASVIATEKLEVLTIWRSDFLQLLAENFAFTRRLLAEMSKRLRDASSRIESLVTMDVNGRLARYLLELAANQGREVHGGYVAFTRPTHQAIANTIGTSRETVSRMLNELMEQGVILSERKTIYLRREALRRTREAS